MKKFGILLVIFISYITDSQESPSKTKDQSTKIYQLNQNTKFTYSINLVDDDKMPVKGVEVDIVKTKITGGSLFNPLGVDIHETVFLEKNQKNFDLSGYISAVFTFKKIGYYPVKKNILNESNQKNMKDTIILRKINKLPNQELEGGRIQLSYKKESESAKIIQKGWLYKKDSDGDIKESVKFKLPSDVELYVTRDKKEKNKLYLVSTRKDTGFILMSSIKDLTYLSLAPQNGYKQKISFIINLNNGNKNIFYCYWKLHGKYFGKMKIKADLTDYSLEEDFNKEDGNYISYNLFIDYYLSTDGLRNVTTLD